MPGNPKTNSFTKETQKDRKKTEKFFDQILTKITLLLERDNYEMAMFELKDWSFNEYQKVLLRKKEKGKTNHSSFQQKSNSCSTNGKILARSTSLSRLGLYKEISRITLVNSNRNLFSFYPAKGFKLKDHLKRLVDIGELDETCFLTGVLFYKQTINGFKQNFKDVNSIKIFLVCLYFGQKLTLDRVWGLSEFSKLAGLARAELKDMEIVLFTILKFEINFGESQFFKLKNWFCNDLKIGRVHEYLEIRSSAEN